MKFKRLLSSFLCAVMLVGTLTVPAFAATGTDASGNKIYISDNNLNNEVSPLSEAPEADYMFIFNDVEFSNYVKFEPAYSGDAQNNQIFVARITIGLGGVMKSNKGNVEFMAYPRGFNMIPTYLKGYGADSDLVAYKTNTPYMAKKSGTYSYLDDLYITPYSDSARAEDGTWDAGLTWKFEKNPDKVRENGSYLDIFYIRVDHGTKISYFEVRVTDDTEFHGARTAASEKKPVETPVLKSFQDVAADRWSHNAIMLCVEKGAISGTRTPDANGVGSFDPTGKVTLGQFLAVDAVTLPKELVDAGWKISVSVWGYKKEHVTIGALELGGGGYTLSSGESGPLKVLGYEGSVIHDIPSEPDMVKDIDWLQVSVSLSHKDHTGFKGSVSEIKFKTASTFTTQGYYATYPNASLNTKSEWVDMDLSFLFKNVGLTK